MTVTVTLPAFAMITDSYVQLVHIKNGKSFNTQITTYYDTLENAVLDAVSGDVIEIFDNVTVQSAIVIPEDIELTIVSGTKRDHTTIYGDSAFESTDKNATTRTIKKNFNGSLFTLSKNSKVTMKNIILDGNGKDGTKGGLIYANAGSTLTLTKGECKSGVILKNSKLGQNSQGGAIYAQKGASIVVENASFSGNTGSFGDDIYAEQETDVTITSGIVVDFEHYDDKVEISGLNIILSGEIGLMFHISVPEKYLDGTFVMTSRRGKSVTLNISQCSKDELGRYTAKYNVNPLELSEQVTLKVYDKDKNLLATTEKSVEDYGKLLLESTKTTDNEKKVIKALLNYGHFAQIEYYEYEDPQSAIEYARTEKCADLSTSSDAFDKYSYTWTGDDTKISQMAVQIELGYKTNIVISFPVAQKPTVLVNGKEAVVKESDLNGYNYCINIEGISALDLAKEFTVDVNNETTLKLSAMSYCKLATTQCSENCKNAVKALYEFYIATALYNK